MSALSSRKSSASLLSDDGCKAPPSSSLATRTVQRALKSQGREWFDFVAQRSFGIGVFLLLTVHPLQIAKHFPEQLNWFYNTYPVLSTAATSYFLYVQMWLMLGLCSIIYTLNIPFFEKCKSNEDPWPWQENPEEHQRSFKRMAIKTAINTLILSPPAQASLVQNGLIRWNTDFND